MFLWRVVSLGTDILVVYEDSCQVRDVVEQNERKILLD